jgi:hypothetical protein
MGVKPATDLFQAPPGIRVEVVCIFQETRNPKHPKRAYNSALFQCRAEAEKFRFFP